MIFGYYHYQYPLHFGILSTWAWLGVEAVHKSTGIFHPSGMNVSTSTVRQPCRPFRCSRRALNVQLMTQKMHTTGNLRLCIPTIPVDHLPFPRVCHHWVVGFYENLLSSLFLVCLLCLVSFFNKTVWHTTCFMFHHNVFAATANWNIIEIN